MARELSESAKASKMIKAILKKSFPSQKFAVSSKNYSGGSNVRVGWTDGVAYERVNKKIQKFQKGHFDGMQDLYEYSNSRKDIPQAKFVFAERSMSDKVRKKLIKQHNKSWVDRMKIDDWDNASWDKRRLIHEKFEKTNFKDTELKNKIKRMIN